MSSEASRIYVIDEDEHLENLRKIILRDFFPHHLQADSESINLSLNGYLSHFKSNENQFFAEMVHSSKQEWQKAHWWIGKQDQLLMLGNQTPHQTDHSQQPFRNMLGEANFNGLNHKLTKQQALNAIFFNKDTDYGSCLQAESEQAKKVIYTNCRIQNLERNFAVNSKQDKQDNEQYQRGEIPATPVLQGQHRDNETHYQAIGGGKYQTLPEPQPDPQTLQLMTWGQIESTPFRVSPADDFQIQDIPQREQILHKLNTKITKSKRPDLSKKSELVSKLMSSMTPAQRSSRYVSSMRRVDSVKRGKQPKEVCLVGLLKLEK